MAMIDLSILPQEIRDVIELREATDMTFSRFADSDYSEIWWDILRQRADPNVEHSMLLSIFGAQGSGKSSAAISMCCFLDPNFSVDNIFFNYDDLVRNRHKLKPNSAVLVDEQSQSYGLDSHRIMVILSQLKEQLRKKSIHFLFCAPVLYEESKTSMYQMEIMFVDRQNMEAFAALKTREGLTLGHVRVPHPMKPLSDGRSLASPELVSAYQKKKDEHLERVLGQRNVDVFEERANMIMESDLFKRAEKIYKQKYGFIPQSTVIQIINKMFPEYNAGVVPVEIAGRIKLNKELAGEWDMPGKSKEMQKKPVSRGKK
jgi:aryl carrier-like protein